MRKLSFLLFVAIVTSSLYAQTYTIVSRNNQDTIKMYPNSLMGGLKSAIPGSKTEQSQYRLIKKVYQGRESLIFVEFSKILDKILIAYETNLVTPGEWQMSTISYSDLYKSVVRKNAIYLEGTVLGMKVELFQRPSQFDDIANIDGVEFALPMKLAIYENELIQKAEKEKEKEMQKMEKDMKEGFDEHIVADLAAKEVNKAYIALLLKTQKLERSYSSDVKKYFNYSELQNLMNTLTIEQLEEKSKGHSKYFEKYEVYR